MTDLNVLWFVLLAVMLTAYAILDGFDLGVGIVLNLLARTEAEKRTLLSTIAPLWDGNEVWLVCFGGAFFGAFPDAYAAAFSGFYLPFMALLAALLLRAVAMELRDHETWSWWRKLWDLALGAACLLTSAVFGCMIANALAGVPLGTHHEFAGTLADLFSVGAGLVAFKTIMLFALHGTLFLRMRIEPGALLDRVTRAAWIFWIIYLLSYAAVSYYAWKYVFWEYTSLVHLAIARVAMGLKLALMVGSGLALAHSRPVVAFMLSAANIACLAFLYAAVLFPNLIASHADPGLNLTIYNSASSQGTLSTMRWVALVGMPLALAYTGTVYWVFRAKAREKTRESSES
ncbi:MAG: cytochrome c oxidase assembly protein [Candidatus Xenobia bacterium]